MFGSVQQREHELSLSRTSAGALGAIAIRWGAEHAIAMACFLARLHLCSCRSCQSRPRRVARDSDQQAQFVRRADIVSARGVVTLILHPNAVHTLTTTRGQKKGGFDAVPAPKAIPFPLS